MKINKEICGLELVVKKHVNNTNRRLKTLEGSSGRLFDAVKKAVDAFGTDNYALKLYRQQLESNHRSTISMMIRVAKNGLIRKHETKLPASYQTLNELIKLISELEKSDISSFELLIQKGQIHLEMTKSDVMNLRNEINAGNIALTYKTADFEQAPVVKIAEVNEKAPLKTLSLDEIEDFVTNLDETIRRRLIELLTKTQNENREAA
jgi:hypothetical protein